MSPLSIKLVYSNVTVSIDFLPRCINQRKPEVYSHNL